MPLSIAPTKVFWCEATSRVRRYLRCYQSNGPEKRQIGVPAVGDPPACAKEHGYCNAMRVLDEIDREFEPPNEEGKIWPKSYDPKLIPWEAFPLECEHCRQTMTAPERQVFVDEIYEVKTGLLTGFKFVRREAPIGAMWEIEWYRDIPDWCGRDGLALNVVTPGGEWHVDGRANNCTKPDDHVHRCWVRSGDPKTGYVHIDKDSTVQPTCEAGAGSIWINKDGPRDWHGFLHRGYLCNADDRPSVDAIVDGRAPANPVAPAERVLTPVRLDAARARAEAVRRTPARPTPAPKRGAAARRWRSNR